MRTVSYFVSRLAPLTDRSGLDECLRILESWFPLSHDAADLSCWYAIAAFSATRVPGPIASCVYECRALLQIAVPSCSVHSIISPNRGIPGRSCRSVGRVVLQPEQRYACGHVIASFVAAESRNWTAVTSIACAADHLVVSLVSAVQMTAVGSAVKGEAVPLDALPGLADPQLIRKV